MHGVGELFTCERESEWFYYLPPKLYNLDASHLLGAQSQPVWDTSVNCLELR